LAQVSNVPRRFRFASRLILAVLFLVSGFWLLLYFDALHQRRKAESLFTALKSFPFASADFTEVRDLVLSHGGSGVQEFPPSLPTLGFPTPPSQGQVQIPSVWPKPRCTSRDCVLEVWIRPSLLTVTLSYPSEMRLLSAMTYAGIRPWGVYATFEIVDGKLKRSRTSVGGLKNGTSGGYEGAIPLEYEVISDTDPVYGDQSYSVGRPHITGGPLEILQVRMTQIPGMPTAGAYDVNLRCLTAVSHGCTFSELAPSAWGDYQRELSHDARQ
jgi:hypothetical protein